MAYINDNMDDIIITKEFKNDLDKELHLMFEELKSLKVERYPWIEQQLTKNLAEMKDQLYSYETEIEPAIVKAMASALLFNAVIREDAERQCKILKTHI